MLVIPAANSLSDERVEVRIGDRLWLICILGLRLPDRVPDARTIWLFRETHTRAGAIRPLFGHVVAARRASDYIALGFITSAQCETEGALKEPASWH